MGKFKTVKDLRKFREKLVSEMKERFGDKYKIFVDCGSVSKSVGGEKLFNFLRDEISKVNVNAEIVKTGGIGLDTKEPVIAVRYKGETVFYGNMDIEKAKRVLESHIKNGKVVEEYMIAMRRE